jgi:multidrug efflux pump subunit AcrA (membrane-fusion protein)
MVRVGMGANLKILTDEKKGVLLVPNRALKNAGTRKAVHILAPGEPRDVIVEVGLTDGNETEILSGLTEGDQVSVN